MKTTCGEENLPRKHNSILARALIAAAFLICAISGLAQLPPGGCTNCPTYTPLDSWSFSDHTNWISDHGFTPVSFTNLGFSYLGDGASMVLDSTNPAWLQYNVVETNGATNLTVNVGSVTFWFAPNWASTNVGGNGPGEWGRLLEVGGYTPGSSFGWWSLYCDDGGNNLYFSAQTNDSSGTFTTYLSAPISWTTNYFHFVALTYSATNTALYLDGGLVTNGPPVTVYPGQNALAHGFFIGSDSNGVDQSHGLFNDVATYNVPLNAATISRNFNAQFMFYLMNPWNAPYMSPISSAPSTPEFTSDTYNAVSGQGNLQWIGSASSCWNGTDAYNVWITNVTVTAASNGKMNVTFTIEGGSNGVPYDVFANSVLSFGPNGIPWTWLGQGYQCNTYTLTNLPNIMCFVILGTPQDTSGYGLTDAYELLVLKANPDGPQTDSYGVPYAWYVQNGINPLLGGASTADPDHDGILNYQEYLYGTRPQVSEGFTVWVSKPGTSSELP